MRLRRVSDRVRSLPVSPTLAVMMEARRLRDSGVDVIDFGPGEPDFRTPEPVCRAATAAMAAGRTHYTDTRGIPELRAAIARWYGERFSSDFDPSEVLIGCGAKNILFLLSLALFQPGDRVALFTPFWVSFPEQIRLAGAEPLFFRTEGDSGFLPRARLLEEASGRGIRAVILNSPCNPTGAMIPPEEMERFVRLAEERDLLLISDECYEAFCYGPETEPSFARFRERLRDRLVIVNSFSKTFAMTGWRVGFALGPEWVLREVKKLQSHDTTQTSSISQWAAIAAIREGGEFVRGMREEFRRRRDIILQALRGIPGVRCDPPPGAFYVFPNVEELCGRLGASDTVELAARLLREARIATVPGEAFGRKGHLRFSYALSRSDLKRGMERFASLPGSI